MADHRTYELVLILDPSLEIEQTETELRRYQDMMAAGGLARRWERWGKRRLAYEIRGKQYGFYALAIFDLKPELVAELDRQIRLNTNIIRHLLTTVDPSRVPEVDAEAVRTLGATVPPTLSEPEVPSSDTESIPAIVDDVIDEDVEAITE